MGVQFPDLQVLLPRSVDVGRIEATSVHQQTQSQQALAHEHMIRAEQRLQQVRTKADDSLRAHADGGGRDSGSGASRRERRKGAKPKERTAEGPTGQRIDVLA